jgi:hypothetical protein
MSTSKHPNQPEWGEGEGPPDDLQRNPGIGQSAGLATGGGKFEDIQADNTVEGDTANNTTPQGGIKVDDWGRTNK